jgi:hypothetical protein
MATGSWPMYACVRLVVFTRKVAMRHIIAMIGKIKIADLFERVEAGSTILCYNDDTEAGVVNSEQPNLMVAARELRNVLTDWSRSDVVFYHHKHNGTPMVRMESLSC